MSLIQRENRVGIKKGSTWGTPVEPTTNDGIFVKSHSTPKGGRKVVTNEDEFGRGMATAGEILEYESQSGSMSMRVYSEGIEAVIASLMGIYTCTADNPEVGVNQHVFKMATVMDSIFHTFAWDEGDEVKAVNSAKIISGTFSYADGLNLDINYLGDKVSITGFTNPLGVTYPSEGKGIFKLINAVVQINGEGDADFTTGDNLNPSGISIAVTRGFEALPVTAGNDCISEPLEKSAPVVEVTLNFPKKETATAAYFNAFHSRDYKKMRIKFEGNTISGTSSKYTIEFNFPKLLVMEAPDFAQDTPIPTTIKLKVLKSTAAPTGMNEIVPYILMQNQMDALTGYPST
jgi:hypothetical protein